MEQIMKKITIFLISFVFAFNAFSAKLSEKERMLLTVLDIDQFTAELNKFKKEFKNQVESDAPEALPLMVIRDKIKIYSQHPFVEADTGVSSKWFKSVFGKLDQVTEQLRKVQISKEIKDPKGYVVFSKECKKSYGSLLEGAKKPIKASKGQVKSLRKKAYRVRKELQKKFDKEMAQKENAKENSKEKAKKKTSKKRKSKKKKKHKK
jgi:hypothetical protein